MLSEAGPEPRPPADATVWCRGDTGAILWTENGVEYKKEIQDGIIYVYKKGNGPDDAKWVLYWYKKFEAKVHLASNK